MKVRTEFVSNSSTSSYVIRYDNKANFIKFINQYRYLLSFINYIQYGEAELYGYELLNDQKFNAFLTDIQADGIYGLNVGNIDQIPEEHNIALYALLALAESQGFQIRGYDDTSYHNDWIPLKELEKNYLKQKENYVQ